MAYNNNNGSGNEEDFPEIDLTLRLGLPVQNDRRGANRNAPNMNRSATREFVAAPHNLLFNVAFVNQQLAARPHAVRNSDIYINNNNNNNNNIVIRICIVCGSLATPLWRKGPQGRRTLCNACGLKFLRAKNKNADKRRQGEGDRGGGEGGANGNIAVC